MHAQIGGHPVGHLVPLAVAGRRVREDVDEARGDDETAGVQGGPTGQGFEADSGDGVAIDSQVADGVEARLGVHDPTTGHHHVVDLVGGGRWGLVEGRGNFGGGGCRDGGGPGDSRKGACRTGLSGGLTG